MWTISILLGTYSHGKQDTFQLSKGTPVTYKQILGSDIIVVRFSLSYGIKDEPANKKALPGILFKSLQEGSKDYSKLELYNRLEKYSSSISCSACVEYSTCDLTTVNSYLKKVLPLLSSIIKKPIFDKNDLELVKAHGESFIKRQLQKPNFQSNEVVNEIFYNKSHPYWISYEKRLLQMKEITAQELKERYSDILKNYRSHIVAIGSLATKDMKAALEKNFGTLTPGKTNEIKVAKPRSEKSFMSRFAHRNTKTAYIKIKFNVPGIADPENAVTNFMLNILDDELSTEIRTRRSLSYSVYSYGINYHYGIGVIGATTSKPKETLIAIREVIKKISTQEISQERLRISKPPLVTSHYLKMEDHLSLLKAIQKNVHHFGSSDRLYQYSKQLNQFTPQDVLKVAKKYLNNFKVAVVYDKNKFNKKWFEVLK